MAAYLQPMFREHRHRPLQNGTSSTERYIHIANAHVGNREPQQLKVFLFHCALRTLALLYTDAPNLYRYTTGH
jgi:hypothetical protein